MNDEGSLILGSKTFQEKTKRSTHTEMVKKIADGFIDKKSGLVKRSLSVERLCPICGASPDQESRIIFIKDGFPYRKCSSCHIVYVSPMLRHEVLEDVYKSSGYARSWMNVLLNPTEQEFNRPKFEEGIRQLEKLNGGNKGRLLDIGCAVGQFLKIADEYNWKVTGIELNEDERKHVESMGYEVKGNPLGVADFPEGTFDAITMWEVLEHVINPREIIEIVYRILKPGGLLLVVVPNVDSLAAQILQEKCNMFFGMSHITMFNNATLTEFLKNNNFRIEHRSTFISELNILNNYLQYCHPYLGDASTKHIVLDMLNDSYINRNYLGYKLKIIARK